MPEPLAPLPDDAVLVHIGPHKTGTSALQSVAQVSREALAEHGVSYPGRWVAHHNEARALRQQRRGWGDAAEAAPDPRLWEELVEEVARTPGRVLISSENFAQAGPDARARLVRDIGPERVHLLTAARDPAGMATSTWQQVLRLGRPVSLESWLEAQFRLPDGPPVEESFWGFADPAALVARWTEVVRPDRITVTVLDPRDRQALPRTVEELLDLPTGLLSEVAPPDHNRGLTGAEAVLLERVLDRLDGRLTWLEYSNMVRYGVLMRMLRMRTPGPDEARIQLPEWAYELSLTATARSVEGLRASGARLVGDLDALTSPRRAVSDEPVTQVPVEAAAEAVVGAVSMAVFGDETLVRKPPPVKAPKRRRKQVRPVEAVPTRELAGILLRRVRQAAGRRVRRLAPSGEPRPGA